MKNQMLACLTAAIVALSATTFIPAARVITAGEVRGTVSDPSGAVVPGAIVTLTGHDTGNRRAQSIITDPAGTYEVDHLAPGRYSVSVQAPGFSRFTEEGLVVEPGQESEADATLAIRQATQAVTVTASRTAHGN
jgi:hypothetical protein